MWSSSSLLTIATATSRLIHLTGCLLHANVSWLLIPWWFKVTRFSFEVSPSVTGWMRISHLTSHTVLLENTWRKHTDNVKSLIRLTSCVVLVVPFCACSVHWCQLCLASLFRPWKGKAPKVRLTPPPTHPPTEPIIKKNKCLIQSEVAADGSYAQNYAPLRQNLMQSHGHIILLIPKWRSSSPRSTVTFITQISCFLYKHFTETNQSFLQHSHFFHIWLPTGANSLHRHTQL